MDLNLFGVNVPMGLTHKSVNASSARTEPFALKKRTGKLVSQKGEEPISRQSFGRKTLCTRRGLGSRQVLVGNSAINIKTKGAGWASPFLVCSSDRDGDQRT